MIRRWIAALAAGAALAFALPAGAEVAVPPLQARVTDLTGTLSASQIQSLDSRLREFERAKGSQIAVLILPTTQPETIEQYSIRVAETWKIGRSKVDDGVIVVVAKDDRTLRVEVGRGLEGAIPDAIAKRVVSDVIAPHFRSGDFYGGLAAGTDALMRLIEGEALPVPKSRQIDLRGIDFQTIFWLFAVLVFGDAIFKRVLGRVPGAAVSGTLVGAIVWFAAGVMLYAMIGGLFGFVVTLANGMASRRSGWTSGGGWGGG
ncbi:MAG TPA: TPM domain-containing protein, partial [Casimicrobiaceae bacterium]|nr:TPM domain-containing protein [Casimicrobiaceae bacterium]